MELIDLIYVDELLDKYVSYRVNKRIQIITSG